LKFQVSVAAFAGDNPIPPIVIVNAAANATFLSEDIFKPPLFGYRHYTVASARAADLSLARKI
jgi:hypothetical protein